jgi:hypothetical protein
VVSVLLALTLACSADIRSESAVRQGVLDHLAGVHDLNIRSMNVQVTSVVFRENEADATVSITPDGGGGGMTMRYVLERKGNRWVVKQRADSGQNPHGAMGASGAGQLPPGHPAIPPPSSPAR